MGRYARKKQHKGDRPLKEKYRLKRRTKDLDQIQKDMKPENAAKLLNQAVDLDAVGNAQFYCLHCARYFINNTALKDHFRTKLHKRKMKKLQTEAFTQEEAERAAGFGSYIAPQKTKVVTQAIKETTTDSAQNVTATTQDATAKMEADDSNGSGND